MLLVLHAGRLTVPSQTKGGTGNRQWWSISFVGGNVATSLTHCQRQHLHCARTTYVVGAWGHTGDRWVLTASPYVRPIHGTLGDPKAIQHQNQRRLQRGPLEELVPSAPVKVPAEGPLFTCQCYVGGSRARRTARTGRRSVSTRTTRPSRAREARQHGACRSWP